MGKLSTRDRKLAHIAGKNVTNIEDHQFATLSVSASQTFLQGPLRVQGQTGFGATARRISWLYIGYTQKAIVVDYVQFIQTGAIPVGTQVGEVALGTTTSAPDGTNKTITCVAATDVLPDLTIGSFPSLSGIVRQNITALAFTVSPATHLWAACRFDFTTQQPTCLGAASDLSGGWAQLTNNSSPITAGTSYLGTVPSLVISAGGAYPALRLQVKA